MRLGVISDSHIRALEELPPQTIKALAEEVDLIIHCGDIISMEVLEGLKKLGVVRAVRGNMDSPDVREILPETDIVTAGNKRLGIVHGWGSPWTTEQNVSGRFRDVDAVLFGHTHHRKNEVVNGVYLFNPGPARHFYGIITVEDDIKGEIYTV